MSETEIKKEIAEALHGALAQHLVGTLLAAQALLTSLRSRGLAESRDAEKLVELLKEANGDLVNLICKLDKGSPR